MDALKALAEKLWRFYASDPLQLAVSVVIAAALALAVLGVELCLVGWSRSSLRQLAGLSNSSRTDLLAFLLVETSLGLFIGMAMFFGVTYLFQRLVGAGLQQWVGRLTLPSQVLGVGLFFLLIDLANYWSHRLCHTVPALWAVHRYHHSAPEMTVLTASRDHPMERAFSSALVAVPAALVALPPAEFAVVHMLAKLVGFLKHSNLRSNWGWIGRYLIQSPAAHRLHHSTDSLHHNKNFASLFQFWDVLFGTAVHPSRQVAEGLRIGVDGDDGQAPPLAYVFRIFTAGWRRALAIRHG